MAESKFKKVLKLIGDRDYRWLRQRAQGKFDSMPDEEYLLKLFEVYMGYRPDLNDPKTYNEKIQWLKLYDRKDIYSTMVDKAAAKDYVAGLIGEEYIVPTYGVWDRAEDIDFDALPEQFVLKCTHDSHALVICRDKSRLDRRDAVEKLNAGLKRNYYLIYREWPYKNVKPRIIGEQYIEDSPDGGLADYKFMAFGGEVKALYLITDRQKEDEETKIDFYDADFNHLDIQYYPYPNSDKKLECPENFEKMKELAAVLAGDLPHIRVDFYNVYGKIYFGELTFASGSGLRKFVPDKWDRIFGEWIRLPEK